MESTTWPSGFSVPEKNAELTRSACSPRGAAAPETIHLPSAVANELTEAGWPAKGTAVVPDRWDCQRGSAHPRNRKVELYPVRYDRRPVYMRALELRADGRGE